MKFHHIGIACLDISEEIKAVKKIHELKSISPIVFDKEQDVELCLVETSEGFNIEFIAGKRVESWVKKRISYYHVCYIVDKIESQIERLVSLGAMLVSDVKPAILFDCIKVAFLQVS